MRGPTVWCFSLVAAAALSLASLTPAAAEPPSASAPTVLDATHFVLVRGDRIVIYEIDPKKGYDLRVVNSALVDESGRIVGQFRPETSPAAAPPAATPAPEPAPAEAAPIPLLYSARRTVAPAPGTGSKAIPGSAHTRRGSMRLAQG